MMIEEGGGEKAGVRVSDLMLLITMTDPIVVRVLWCGVVFEIG